MIQSRIPYARWLGALTFALFPLAATAAPVAPGESVAINFPEPLEMPTGEKLAERVLPFTLEFELPPGATSNPSPSTTGTLTNSVYRNDTGRLVFVYDMVIVDEVRYADEISLLSVDSFAGFTTDVRGRYDAAWPSFRASRSADGATLSTIADNGLGGAPIFIIETDATEFNDQGTASFFAVAEFVVRDPARPDSDQLPLDATVNFTGLFQPIPLPPGAWAAILTAGTLGAGARVRRSFRRA